MRGRAVTGPRLLMSAVVMAVGTAAVLLSATGREAGGKAVRGVTATAAPPSHGPAPRSRPGGERSGAKTTSTTVGPVGAAMSAADAFVLAYAGYDWHHPGGDPSAWRALATPELFAQLTGPSGSGPGMTPAQVGRHETAVPRLRSTTWGSGTPTAATVLVDCLLTVSSDQGPTQQQDLPYPLTLVDRGGVWLVSSVGETGSGA